MVDASISEARVRAHPIRPSDGAVLPRSLVLDPPVVRQSLVRLVLIGLGPLGVMGLIAGGVAIGRLLGW